MNSVERIVRDAKIIERHKAGASITELAAEFKLTYTGVRRIVLMKPVEHEKVRLKVERNARMIEMRQSGKSIEEIAKAFKVSIFCVFSVCKGVPGQRRELAIATAKDIADCRNQIGMTWNELAFQLGLSARLLEMWVFERKKIPHPYERIVYLALSNLEARHSSQVSNKRARKV